MTREAFDALSDEEAFNLCCSGIVNGTPDEDDERFDINNAPYQLTYRKTKSYSYGACKYTGKSG